MISVTVRHTFEAGHRLPQLGGKCQSLHGHSWSVDITFAGGSSPLGADGVLVEFATLKAGMRQWIDTYLDHGVMLGVQDPLVQVLSGAGKIYRFGAQPPGSQPESLSAGLLWPTVENVATLLSRVGDQVAAEANTRVVVSRVLVQETAVNAAEWLRDTPTPARPAAAAQTARMQAPAYVQQPATAGSGAYPNGYGPKGPERAAEYKAGDVSWWGRR